MRSENIGVKRGEGAVCLKGDTLILGASVGDSVFLCVCFKHCGLEDARFSRCWRRGCCCFAPRFPPKPPKLKVPLPAPQSPGRGSEATLQPHDGEEDAVPCRVR